MPGHPVILFNYDGLSSLTYVVAPAEMLREAGDEIWRVKVLKTASAPYRGSLVWVGSPHLVRRSGIQ
jgi:hypothetical protein